MKKILEIGPAVNPMHHRHGDRLQHLGPDERIPLLREDESYTALDQPMVDFSHRVWQVTKQTYGDRVQYVNGDRADLPFPDESFDELVSLGSYVNDPRLPLEYKRVLKAGGVLRMGATVANQENFLASWGVRLRHLGFTLLEDEKQSYTYSQRKGLVNGDYVVFSFKKGS